MFCRKCGKQIPDDSEFCYKCGAPVMTAPAHTETDKREQVNLEKEKPKPPTENTDKRVCARCGKEILSQSVRFCPHCGENLPQSNKGANRTVSQNVSLSAISSHKCDGCGELVYNNQRSCHNCGASNPSYNSRYDNLSATSDLKRAQNTAKSHMQDTGDESKSHWGCIVPIVLAIIFVIGGVLSPGEAACALAEGAGEGLIEGLFGLVIVGVIGMIVNLIRKSR